MSSRRAGLGSYSFSYCSSFLNHALKVCPRLDGGAIAYEQHLKNFGVGDVLCDPKPCSSLTFLESPPPVFAYMNHGVQLRHGQKLGNDRMGEYRRIEMGHLVVFGGPPLPIPWTTNAELIR